MVYDRGRPEPLLAAVRARPRATAEVSPAEGAPGDVGEVAATLVAAARSGLRGGAPGRRRPVRARRGGQGGAGRRPHRGAVRGRAGRRPARPASPTYAGVPLPGVAHRRRRRRRQRASTSRRCAAAVAAARWRSPSTPATSAAVRDGAAGRRRRRRDTPVAVTGDGTGDTQYTTDLDRGQLRRGAALGFTGRVVLTVGAGVDRSATAVLVGEPPAVRLEGARAADQGAGRRDERAAARVRGDARARCRPSRSSRRAPRPRWSGRSRAWSTAGTPGSSSPRSTRSARCWEKFDEYGLDARALRRRQDRLHR